MTRTDAFTYLSKTRRHAPFLRGGNPAKITPSKEPSEKMHYKQRKQTVELVFGIIKEANLR